MISGIQICLQKINFRHYIFNLYNFWTCRIQTCFLWKHSIHYPKIAGSNPASSDVVKVVPKIDLDFWDHKDFKKYKYHFCCQYFVWEYTGGHCAVQKKNYIKKSCTRVSVNYGSTICQYKFLKCIKIQTITLSSFRQFSGKWKAFRLSNFPKKSHLRPLWEKYFCDENF